MPQTEHDPLVSVLGTRENCDGSVTSREANGSVSCLPTGVLSDGISSSKSPTWKKSGMRLTLVLFHSWFNLKLQGVSLRLKLCLFCIIMIIACSGRRESDTDCVSEESARNVELRDLSFVEEGVGVGRERGFLLSERLSEAIAWRNKQSSMNTIHNLAT